VIYTCRERIYIPYGKPYLYLEGAGKKKTFVVSVATLISLADNIIAEGISFIVRKRLSIILYLHIFKKVVN